MSSVVMSGILNLSETYPTFAEPVFTNDSGAACVQDIDPRTRRVRRFLVLDSTDAIVRYDGPEASIGDISLVCFARSKDSFIVGSPDFVAGAMEESAKALIPLSVQMQIDDLLGNRESILVSRQKFQNAISDTSKNSAKAFELAFAHSILWDEILSISTSDVAEIPVHHIMRSASVDVTGGQLVPLIEDWLSEILGSTRVERIVRNFVYAIKPEKQGELFASAAPSSQPSDFWPNDASLNLRGLRRQEQRLAQILELVIENPSVGFPLLESHRDSAAFANRALTHARQHLRYTDDTEQAILLISRMIPAFYSMSFPMNRGIMLWEFAARLGRYRPIADAIRQKLRETNAKYVNLVESDIHRILDGKTTVPVPNLLG